MLPDAEPVAVSAKSLASTPVTDSLKVTVYWTEEALVDTVEEAPPVRAMELTLGVVATALQEEFAV